MVFICRVTADLYDPMMAPNDPDFTPPGQMRLGCWAVLRIGCRADVCVAPTIIINPWTWFGITIKSSCSTFRK